MPTPDDQPHRLDNDAPSNEDHARDQDDTEEGVILATVIGEEIVQEARVGVVRTGSPFAKDPPVVKQRAGAAIRMRQEFEAGMWRITAGSATIAAGMLVVFALLAFLFFQTGALLIAGLGGVMSLLGLTSIYPKWSLGFLLIHIGLFVSTFWMTMQT